MKLLKYISLFLIILASTVSMYANDLQPGALSNAQVIIYPNPVTEGNITLKSDQRIEKVEILNILGQIVQTEDLNSVYISKLDIDLQSGIYLIRIIFTDKTYSTKRIRVN